MLHYYIEHWKDRQHLLYHLCLLLRGDLYGVDTKSHRR